MKQGTGGSRDATAGTATTAAFARPEVELHCTIQSLAETSPAPPPLTGREVQCLCLCARGKSYWETGVILGICERTVSFHMEAVRSKLGAATNAHAIALAWAGASAGKSAPRSSSNPTRIPPNPSA